MRENIRERHIMIFGCLGGFFFVVDGCVNMWGDARECVRNKVNVLVAQTGYMSFKLHICGDAI